jgi:hypothetical protein
LRQQQNQENHKRKSRSRGNTQAERPDRPQHRHPEFGIFEYVASHLPVLLILNTSLRKLEDARPKRLIGHRIVQTRHLHAEFPIEAA